MPDNRRVHKRVPIAGSATVYVKHNADNVSVGAIISNISLSGIGIYAESQIEDGTEITVDMHYISSEGILNELNMKGHVVYTRQMESLFFTGIEFNEEINSRENSALYNHIQQSLRWYKEA